MKVLQITEKNLIGGAAVSMRRLAVGMKQRGDWARALVGNREDPSMPDSGDFPRPSVMGRIKFHLWNLAGLNYAGLPGVRRLFAHPWFQAADVIHFHSLQGGYFNYRWLAAISWRKPILWTLHDMWAVTGHCSHSFDCARWRSGCGSCPYPETYPAIRRDATAAEWRLKRETYFRSRLHIVTPSRWLAGVVGQSMLADKPLDIVNNGVPMDIYRPGDRACDSPLVSIPAGRRIILLASQRMDDPFKDPATAINALRMMTKQERSLWTVVVMGRSLGVESQLKGVDYRCLGFVAGERERAQIYGRADVLLYASRADNQPLVIMEAMACGCPVIASAVGGIPEMVDETVGACVPGRNPGALIEALRRVLNRKDSALLRQQAVARARERYDIQDCVDGYRSIYTTAIKAFHHG